MLEYLGEHISYPLEAKQFGAGGIVYATFVVETDGAISKPEILRDPGYGMSDEVLLVLKKMPKWIPAETKGGKVRCYFTLPVHFQAREGGYNDATREKAIEDFRNQKQLPALTKPTQAKLDSAITIWKSLAKQIKDRKDKKACLNYFDEYRKCNHTIASETDVLKVMDYMAKNCREPMIKGMQYLKDNDLLNNKEGTFALELFMEYAQQLGEYSVAADPKFAKKSSAQTIAEEDLQTLYALMKLKHINAERVRKFWVRIKPIINLVYTEDQKVIDKVTKKLAAYSLQY